MSDAARAGRFQGHRIAEKQTHELIGLARGMLADGVINDGEIDFLHRWLVANDEVKANPMVAILLSRLEVALEDGVITEDERTELRETLQALTANDFELGEVMKSTTLPFTQPEPHINFDGARMCFTGTFLFGKRRECEQAAIERGAKCGSLTQSTNYLVVGEYATDSWKFSSFGNKIMQAVEWQEAGIPIAIVSEAHWRRHL